MKKYLLLFVFLSVSGIIYLSVKSYRAYGEKSGNPHFVSIKDNKFFLNNKPFYPLAINYIVALNVDNNGLWVSPSWDYLVENESRYSHDQLGLKHLKADFDLIKEMGFNTVRIVGVGELIVDDPLTGKLVVNASDDKEQIQRIALDEGNNRQKYFAALKELFGIVNQSGLKIIFLNKMLPEIKNTEIHLSLIATEFKNDTSILAYDLFNEPLYFDKPDRSKQEVHEITRRWHKIVRKYAPDQLMTIGLEGIREAFEWDPTMVDVDFISFHPYEYEEEQVRNELYWYGKYVTLPWIVGETAIPADNDSVTYETQKQFAEKTLEQACNCGAAGYSWWQYKDVKWFKYHADYMGVLSRSGTTQTKINNVPINGTVKPVAEAIKNYNPDKPKGKCLYFKNYYNYTDNTYFKLTGKLVNKDGSPVTDGVIMAWNEDWSKLYHTLTLDDGTFELKSNFDVVHWRVTALRGYMEWGDVKPEKINMANNKRSCDIGEITIRRIRL